MFRCEGIDVSFVDAIFVMLLFCHVCMAVDWALTVLGCIGSSTCCALLKLLLVLLSLVVLVLIGLLPLFNDVVVANGMVVLDVAFI